jgi:5-methylcytosine-specific restriction protein A
MAPGEIHTRTKIKAVFGGSSYGGICPAVAERNVVLYSDEEAGAKFGYKDGWLAEEDEHGKVFEYTAAGTKGDQTFGGRYGGNNSAVLRHAEQGRTLRLFVAVGKAPGKSAKEHRYVGAFELDHETPYRVGRARDESGAMRNVIVFRLRPAGAVEVAEDDKQEPAPQSRAVLVPADTTTAKIVEPERNKNKKGYRSAVPESKAERREAELSDRLEAYLRDRGHTVGRFEIQVKGKTSRLLTDLYDATAHVLYEIKGSNRREYVRMALGQLLDYRRYVSTDEHPEPPRCVGVFPFPPDEDMVELLADEGCTVAHPHGDDFVGALLDSA